ncbi:MAG: ABC transporter permease [Lachnospirales bacterium]
MNNMKKEVNKVVIWLPFIGSVISLLIDFLIPAKQSQSNIKFDYYLFINILVVILAFVMALYCTFIRKAADKYKRKAPFISGIIILIATINLITEKFALLPVIYFPSNSKVIEAIVEDRILILKCLLYSARLLFIGFLGGTLAGIVTGVGIGFNKKISYWLSPIIRFLGPIPATAWIPLVLVCFPSAVSASCFLIGLSVWFPVNIMTSSGIKNITNSMFEVSSTLGASVIYKIFKVGIPAAMPSIFLGIFNGSSSAFVTLMTAEMVGAKYGIGWYVNWEKEMMSYANVYGGLIVIAVVFSLLVTLLFKVRDRVLVWQKGMIKW